MKKNNSKKKPILFIVLVVVVLGAVGFGVWRIVDLQGDVDTLQSSLDQANEELNSLKSDIVSDPNTVVSRLQQEQNAGILDEIGEVYAIPEGETPTIATVEDITKLVDQPFFEGAENGDILVVFNESSQAVLYRPSSKQLVKVGPISTEGAAEATAPAPAAEETTPEE